MIYLMAIGALENGWQTLLMFLALLLGIALWLWAVVDIARGRFEGKNDKLLWLAVVLLVPVLGVLLYLILGRKRRMP